MFKVKFPKWCCILSGLIVLLSFLSASASSDLVGELTPGQFSVGFETVELFDHSRTYVDKYDYDGNLRSTETSRPIQVCVWYPAGGEESGVVMGYGEYVFPAPEDNRFYALLSNLQGRELGYLLAILGGQRAMVQDLMNLSMSALRDAPRAEGSFPLIIYHPDGMGGLAENAALCEYLASHGYIVATSHAMGSADLNVSANPVEIETMIRDREFVFGFMDDYPYVDNNRPAVLGFGLGGLTALLMQMRNTDIELVATLDPVHSYVGNIELAETFPSFSRERMDVPQLNMLVAGDTSVTTILLDSLNYSLRFETSLEGFGHNDYSHYALASAIMTDTTGVVAEIAASRYKLVCESALRFFDTYFKGDTSQPGPYDLLEAMEVAIVPDSVASRVTGRQKPPPTETQFVEMIQEGRIDRAVEIYDKLKAANPELRFFREQTMNMIGYRLLQGNRLSEACKVFRINADTYPKSANVWDSYADALIASGDIETAIKCYKNVLDVLPADSAVDPRTREYLINNANESLETLQK